MHNEYYLLSYTSSILTNTYKHVSPNISKKIVNYLLKWWFHTPASYHFFLYYSLLIIHLPFEVVLSKKSCAISDRHYTISGISPRPLYRNTPVYKADNITATLLYTAVGCSTWCRASRRLLRGPACRTLSGASYLTVIYLTSLTVLCGWFYKYVKEKTCSTWFLTRLEEQLIG